MNKASRSLTIFSLSLTALFSGIQAEIVTVNFQTVFEQFNELRVEDQKLRAEVAQFQENQQAKVTALQAKQQTFNDLRNQAAQADMNEDERKELIKEASAQLEELNREEQALRQERAQFQKDLEAKGMRLRRGIVEKVNGKIAEWAEELGWEIVLDSSSKSPNGLPVFIYTSPTMDKTEWVIAELNKMAPTRSEDAGE